MKLPTHEYLEKRGIMHRKLGFPESTPGGAAQVAVALGFRERQMVKTLIFETGEGEPVLVMLGGDQVAKSGLLKAAIGSRNIKMVSRERVREITGYEVGSIPPFHWQPPGFRSFLEISLMDETELGVGAGRWGQEIVLSPADLVKASNATALALVPPTGC